MVFIESRIFTRRLQELAGRDSEEILQAVQAVQADLNKHPERGAQVPGRGGIRKARQANPGRGKGKRGGFRYLYLYLEKRQHIHLILILDKNEQEDCSADQRRDIRALTQQIKK